MTHLPPTSGNRAPSYPPCVGREAELAELARLRSEAEERGERLALLEGATGVGKGRIMQEFKTRVRLGGGVVLEGRAEPGRAFGPFADIVTDALAFLAEVGKEPRADLESFACGQGCHRFWWQHHSTVPGLALSTLSEDPQLAALEKRLRFFDAVRSLLCEVADVRVPVVIVHDVDRADRGTLMLLRFLLDEGTGPWSEDLAPERTLRALFVAGLRTDAGVTLPESLAQLRGLARTESIAVGRLDDAGVRAYLQSPEAVARIMERTGGMPEAIDILLSGDPVTPESRVLRALDDLSAPARALLDALAVLDQPADVDLLAHIAGGPIDTPARNEFAQCELLTRRIVEGTLLFGFHTQRDREQVYGLVPADSRRRMHTRIADRFRGEPGSIAMAARHAIDSGDMERAVPLAMDAAQALATGHDHAEAADLLESLLARATAPHMEVREALAELYRTAGDYGKALEHARAVAAAAPDSSRAQRRVGRVLTLSGMLEEAARALAEARRIAEDSSDHLAVIDVDALLAELHYQRGAHDDAERAAERALAAAQAVDAAPLVIHARNTLARVALVKRGAREALALFEENHRDAVARGLEHQEAQALTNMGVAKLHLRDLRGAELDFQRALNVQGVADTREIAIALENLGVLAHWQRDFRTAQTRYYDAVTLLKRLGNQHLLARVANNLGELYVALGDAGRARAMCDFAAQMSGPGASTSVIVEGLMLRGRIDTLERNLSTASASFHAARDRMRLAKDRREANAARELVRIALLEGDTAKARELLEGSLAPTGPKDSAEHLTLEAELLRSEGKESLAHARRAVTFAEEAGDALLLVPALVSLTHALIDTGDLLGASRAIERAQKTETWLTERVPDEAQRRWIERPMRQETLRAAQRLDLAWAQQDHGTQKRRISSLPPAPRPERRKPEWDERYASIVGSSAQLTSVLGVLDKVAPSDAMVLIRGESGTGKELIAEALHAQSRRRDKPLVKVNCAALVETLLLSELFGHEKGAFTGAQARKKGRFELADGGTIFLDEIGDISPKTQVALLRVLQEHEFERVGGTQPIRVNVRIVAATHRDLEQMVRDGQFREDLYYRLRGVMIRMPALRERLEDLADLARDLLERIAKERGESPRLLSEEALKLLRSHHWPGNVRELENVLRSVTLFAETPVLGPQDFAAFAESFGPMTEAVPRTLAASHAQASVAPPPVEEAVYNLVRTGDHSLLEIKKVIERECISRALRDASGNITKAAQLLGMKRPRLSQLVKEHGLGTDAAAGEPAEAE